MADQVVIFGTGSFAECACFYLEHDSPCDVVAFSVHREHVSTPTLLGRPVIPFEELADRHPPSRVRMFVAVGYRDMNRIRAKIVNEVKTRGYELISYVSSRCTHWGDTTIGENCFIFEDNTIQPFVTIGDDVVLWSGNHIGHHSTIGDHCFISSHVVVCGHVDIEPYCFVGVNAVLRENIRIGEASLIGAGTLIMKPTEPRSVYIGARTKPDDRTTDELSL